MQTIIIISDSKNRTVRNRENLCETNPDSHPVDRNN